MKAEIGCFDFGFYMFLLCLFFSVVFKGVLMLSGFFSRWLLTSVWLFDMETSGKT